MLRNSRTHEASLIHILANAKPEKGNCNEAQKDTANAWYSAAHNSLGTGREYSHGRLKSIQSEVATDKLMIILGAGTMCPEGT